MSIEAQTDSQHGLPEENRPNVLAMGERSLIDVWRVLTKRRYVVLVVAILTTALAVWRAYSTPPVYETSSTIEIKPSSLSSSSAEMIQEEDTVALETEVGVLQSDSVLFQAAQSIGLLDRIRRGQGKVGAAGPDAEEPITPSERHAMVQIVKSGLSVAILPNTRIIAIHDRGTDPVLAAAIVNGLVSTYSDEGLRISFERTAHVSDWLAKQIDNLKQDAAQAQRQLADYQKAHNIVGTDQNSNLTLQTLGRISGELDDAEADRIVKEARLRDFDAMKPEMMALMSDDPAVASLESQLSELKDRRAQMATKLGPRHPAMQQIDSQIARVQAQVDKEVELARRQVRNEYEAAVQLENALRSRLATQEEAAYKLNESVAQYAMLRHQAELARNLYDTLQTNLKEATINAGMAAANITVIDRAEVPLSPVSAPKSKLALLGLLAGLVLGCVMAFVVESIDDRLRTSEEVEHASGLPSLAAIPHLLFAAGRKNGEGRPEAGALAGEAPRQLVTLWDPKSNGAEAYRSMRSALLLSSIDNPPRVIVVTSSFPSEGKTTTALNLAVALAQRNERVLLVDADLRRGSLYRVFGISAQSFGLSTVLSQPGEEMELPAPLGELPMLHVLPTGPRPPNPAEMLSSNRMEEQMRAWVRQFDRVVLDTAPLLAVSDTQALAVRADAVVLVARAGVTRKRALLKSRDLLWRVNAPVAGVAVNDVDLRLEHFYTYRYGLYTKEYFYAYGDRQDASSSGRAYGYEEDDERER